MTLDTQGNLYGNTYDGGANGVGSVFEIAKGSGKITTLASFDGTNGANPFAGLTLSGDGILYGTTNNGGESGVGTVFELTGAVVPEPSSLLLLGLSAIISVGLTFVRKFR